MVASGEWVYQRHRDVNQSQSPTPVTTPALATRLSSAVARPLIFLS